MATTYTHTRVSIVDAAGNVNVLYPLTTGSDVTVSQKSNTILTTKGITTVQELADALRSSAFSDTIDPSSLIDDTAGDGDTSVTWSADRIADALAQVSDNSTSPIVILTQSEYDTLVDTDTVDNDTYYLINAENRIISIIYNSQTIPIGGNSSSNIDIDDAFSSTSENPVQNKVISAAIMSLFGDQAIFTYDSSTRSLDITPTETIGDTVSYSYDDIDETLIITVS